MPRRRRPAAALLLLAALAGCAGPGRIAPYSVTGTPPDPPFATSVPLPGTAWSAPSLARAFVLLTHEMEWGAARPHLVRYEAPVRVRLLGAGAAQYAPFLDAYLRLLATGAGVDIAPAARPDEPANLHVRFVAGPAFERLFPTASCIVAPGRPDWETYRAAPDRYGGDTMAAMTRLDELTIFIPATAPPHLVRGCLIEEIAQALGPANDLWGLGPSIFNDDAAHVWPTRLDLLLLRVLYAPELRTGLGRAETEAAAAAALDRLNPAGRGAPDLPLPGDAAFRGWRDVTLRVFARNRAPEERLADARFALAIAADTAPGGAHHCHSLTVLGRVLRDTDPAAALPVLEDARALCARVHGPADIRLARIDAERAAVLFLLDRPAEALALTGPLPAVFAAHGQEERLANLFALRSAAFRAIHDPDRAAAERRLAGDWGAYALGADSEALARWRRTD